MSGFQAICPSCIGLGKVMREGIAVECTRCVGEGRIPGIGRYDSRGTFLGIDPDPNPEGQRGYPR